MLGCMRMKAGVQYKLVYMGVGRCMPKCWGCGPACMGVCMIMQIGVSGYVQWVCGSGEFFVFFV